MRITILGCSPSFQNAGGHCSGYLVRRGDTSLLVDCGHGSLGSLRSVLDIRQLTAIVLSHMHADHFFDLVPLRYAYRFGGEPESKTPLWLPPGGAAVLDSLTAPLDLDEAFFSGTFCIREYNPAGSLTIGCVELRFAHTKHFIPAYAMRLSPVDDPAQALFFSSDTAPTPDVQALAAGASVALVEATQLHEKAGIQPGHLTGDLAGSLASVAKVGRLVLTHYMEDSGDDLLKQAGSAFQGPVELARELETYQV